jgi:dUTP pyrophosphatase
MTDIPIKRLRAGAILPAYATASSAGADLYACLDAPVEIGPQETKMIPLGFAMAIPAGWVGLTFARSGLASKRDLAPANKVGVIDADYRGEWFIPLHNHGTERRTVEPGERIAQLVLVPCMTASFFEADSLDETARGAGGFGSTGRN